MTAPERELPPGPTPAGSATAGALLRAARESAGLSLDAVAQQLKLAPRQVKALEDDDFALLPGRTFVRGFVRNYARLVRLDADAVLAALPGGNADSGLAAPTLHPTAQSIGELPLSQHSRPGWTRWAIPLTLIAIIAAGAAYELLRPAATTRPPAPVATPPREPVAEPTPVAEPPVAPPALAGAVTTLPNPVAAAEPAATGTTPPTPGTPPGDRELVLSYRDHSWTEVRDRNGRVLLSTMMTPGARQVLSGQGPFELVIGNAADVSVTLDGRKIDLAPHIRQSVARLTLQ
ncbi:MAG: helix-turn-helix domain-containing protein [Betaproteobacteria bacterium]|nr:helix-turn-helix domain-containing protein [Betaproteobacteria bacterium]